MSSSPPPNDEFYKSCYGTLVVSVLVISGTAAAYFYNYRTMFKTDPLQERLGAAVAVAAFVTLFVTHDFHGGKLFGRPLLGLAAPWKERFLPAAVIILLLIVATLCALTGGVLASPFSHYLTAIGGLAIVFARQARTRLLIGLATVAAFWLSGKFYFPLCSSGTDPRCSQVQTLVDSFLLFNFVCVILVSAMAIAAVSRTEPQLPGPESAN
jgi:hypothetical protein